MLTLFAAKNTISVVAGLTLEELGQPYTLELLDFAQGAQTKPAYHKINPKGRVPALATEHGILTETGAVLEYLAALHPEAGLVPTDPFQAAKMREMMYYLASTMHVNHAHKLRGARWADRPESWADMTAKVPETMAASSAYVESCLQGPFLLGAQISLADLYLYAVANWLPGDGVEIADYPKLAHFVHTLSARPSVAALKEKGLL